MTNDFIDASRDKMPMPASKFCTRVELIGPKGLLMSLFLGQLWSLFGEPHDIGYEGFTYQLKDLPSGIVFHAYSAGSGPAYCFAERDKPAAGDVVRRLEDALAAASSADCEIEVDTDYGVSVVGSRNGVPYERMKRNA